jgi:SAM-dependent methyltransferase
MFGMCAMDASTVEFLRAPAGAALMNRIAAEYDDAGALALSSRLRDEFPAEHVAAALTQVGLRRKAAIKFGADAARLLFTSEGLEQATHRHVAEHRARRVVATGATSVRDLGCGIGADLLAFARTGTRVSGVELDPVTAAVAQANLDVVGTGGRVVTGDATSVPLDDIDVVFADPARRGPAGRVFDPNAFSPPWSFVRALLEPRRVAVVKLAPGLPHDWVPDDVEAEWVSLDGHLREAVLWSGRAVDCRRRATVLKWVDDRIQHSQLTDDDDPGPGDVRPVGRFVYEPDDAVVRAHLVTAFAASYNGWLLDPHLAYVSADSLHTTGLGRGYQLVEILPFKGKALRAALRARDIGTLTIKKRGVDVTPEALRARLRLTGSRAATIILTRTPNGAQALLVDPL